MASSDNDTRRWPFEWDRGRGEVAALGGMLGPVWFRLDDGREVQPFALAPWADEVDAPKDLPGILRRLRGEWPCVPFGMPTPPEGLPEGWQANTGDGCGFHTDPHGYGSNHHWTLSRDLGTGIEIAIDYPDPHPVRRLVRRIEGRPGEAAVDIHLAIDVRHEVVLPIGLHPVFALPQATGAARLSLPGARMARSFPVDPEPGVSRLAPDQVSAMLDALPARDGSRIDLTRLPLAGQTEELVQVAMDEGKARLTNTEADYAALLTWDVGQFPFCLLWVSNGGRSHPPWNGRHFALGIEPVAAAFDLGVAIGRAPNPLQQHGKTAAQLSPDMPYRTHYSITVEAI